MTTQKSWQILCFILAVNGLGLAFVFNVLWGETAVVSAAPTACNIPLVSYPIPSVGYYVLAYDNGEEGQFNLAPKYEATVSRLLTATINRPDSVAVILADLGADDDTHILVLVNGVQIRLDCLPNESHVLDTSLQEFDVTDGQVLGDFLMWARAVYPSNVDSFTYIGHGNPVTPYTDPSIGSIVAPANDLPNVAQDIHGGSGSIFPLPTQLDANPSFTDHHAPTAGEVGLITPHALATALAEVTNNGANKLEVVDLLHCFAASIDELHEIAPYTDSIVASPNYAFFDPAMPGIAFESMWSTAIVTLYHNEHPAKRHPHIIMGVEGETVARIAEEWDVVSAQLLQEFDTNPEQTQAKLMGAYLNSIKYDTSVCDADMDWALEPPDALSDMKSFALELHKLYEGQNMALTTALTDTVDALQDALLLTIAEDGAPYFEEDPNHWAFLSDESGISLFTPFQPTEIAGELYLPWQSLWYTDTLSYDLPNGVQINNPEPFDFIASNSQPKWADVVSRFWVEQSLRPGVDVNTFFCTTEMVAFANDAADLQTTLDVSEQTIRRGDSFTVTITISNSNIATATEPLLTFSPHETAVSWLTLQSITPNHSCTTEAGVTRCTLPNMPMTTTEQIQLVYQSAVGSLNEPAQLHAKAHISADSYEPNPIDNTQTEMIDVLPTTQLFLPIVLKPD